jgi:hypothetical protein
MRARITITILGVLAAVALVAVPTAGAATNVHTATLKGSAAFPAVTGSAKFSVDNGIRQLEAEIEHAKPLAGTNVRFRVDGVLVGTAKVNALGTARINKSGSAVPAVHTGSTIRVRRASNGALVASGTFN